MNDESLEKWCEDIGVDPSHIGHGIIYCTYTKFNPDAPTDLTVNDGRIYAGRTRGDASNSPCKIVEKREKSSTHRNMTLNEGYGEARLDSWIYTTRPIANRYSDPSYYFTRVEKI